MIITQCILAGIIKVLVIIVIGAVITFNLCTTLFFVCISGHKLYSELLLFKVSVICKISH